MILPIIMAGGNGTRLWPLSRSAHPKQFLKLNGQHTMIQQTMLRLSDLQHYPSIVICNEEHRFTAAEQCRQIDLTPGSIILEPFGRNTAPAIALGALQAKKCSDKDPILLVLAADHDIPNSQAFTDSVLKAEKIALSGKVVTFGIVPTKPETGYGYIKCGDNFNGDSYCVEKFVEKPTQVIAESYLAEGGYYWNSGMFMVKASVYLDALKEFNPEILDVCKAAMLNSHTDIDFIRPDSTIFKKCPEDSIDFAVMEPLCAKNDGNVVVVPMDANWNDIGSFSALYDVLPKDDDNNVIIGDVITYNTNSCLLYSDYKMISTVGVEDIVVISTKDAVLVASKDRVQDVKDIVSQLKTTGRPEYKYAREVYRPWGKYDSIDSGVRDQVKRITVNPGQKLSLQKHFHRAEHWVVVNGTAEVTKGDTAHLVTENESIYLPIGCVHALYNPGKIPLELIEVQTGSYLGEDDIVRFGDVYGRATNLPEV